MKAIILAAGVGKRLGGGIADRPKCLIDLDGRTLLDRTLDALEELGIREQIVVVGHLADRVEQALASRPGAVALYNPEYRKGAILSLWTAREALDGPVLIMDADVLFPTEMLRRLVESRHENCFLMDGRAANDGEAQMLMARDGRVLDITRGLRGDFDACGESVGFLKLGADAARTLRRLLEETLQRGQDGIEHEEVYPALMRECIIG
ncbi:MAG TPA: phosphocholine cytidylyltransferase family protein, partial [Armatimonadota bacterium]|nr:phosphocholine cytidylyltransferase family protein [Armatimonadota bacterium]